MDDIFGSEILDILCCNDFDIDTLLAKVSDSFEKTYANGSLPLDTPESLESANLPLPYLHILVPTSSSFQPAPPSFASTGTAIQDTSFSTASAGTRFPPPKSDNELKILREQGFPKRTQQDTTYCMNVYEMWRKSREQHCNTAIPPLHTMTATNISYHLTRFIVEARKKNGTEYPANTLHHLITGIMRHLRCNGVHVDFFSDKVFADMRSTLDAEMKRIQSSIIFQYHAHALESRGFAL